MREFKLSNHLEERFKRERGERNHKIQLGAGIFLISNIPGVAVEPAFSIIGGLIFLFFLILAGVLDKSQVIQSGLEGEGILRDKLIQILPDE